MFCLPSLFQVDPGRELNYHIGSTWLLFPVSTLPEVAAVFVSTVPRVAAVHSPAQPWGPQIGAIPRRVTSTRILCGFKVLGPSCQGVPEGIGSMVGERLTLLRRQLSVSCNPVATSLSNPRLSVLLRSPVASHRQTDTWATAFHMAGVQLRPSTLSSSSLQDLGLFC